MNQFLVTIWFFNFCGQCSKNNNLILWNSLFFSFLFVCGEVFLLFWFLWGLCFWREKKKKWKYAMKASFKICDGQPFHVTQGVDHHIRYVIFLSDICGNQHDVITLMLKKNWVVGFIECYCFGYAYWAQPFKQRRDAGTIFCGCYVICVLHSLFLTLKYKLFLIFSWWTLYLWTH